MFVTHESSSLYSFQRSRMPPAPDLTECKRNAPEESDFIDRVERLRVELGMRFIPSKLNSAVPGIRPSTSLAYASDAQDDNRVVDPH
jgi:hypothetical protein